MENEITKGSRKRTRKRLTALERLHQDSNHPVPGRVDGLAIAEGYTQHMNDVAKPDECKSALGESSANPLARALQYMEEQNKSARDMAASATAARGGGGSSSVGNFNAQRAGSGTGRVAVGAPDLDQQGGFLAARLASLRSTDLTTRRGNVVDLNLPESVPGGFSHQGTAHVQIYNARADAGEYDGMNQVGFSPQRPADHPSRTSATRDNGTHALGNVESTAVASKASDRLQVMKDTQVRLG